MQNAPVFSVIIVNWNTKDLTLKAIASIYAQHEPNVEIIVVDNNSSDGSLSTITKMFPAVEIIANKTNAGFARACNQAMSQAKGRYFILLNSDAEILSPRAFETVQKTFENNSQLGILGGLLRLDNGKIQSMGRQLLTLRRLIKEQLLFSSKICRKKGVRTKSMLSVDYVDGAFLVIPASVVKSIGMLREDFFMYGEDMEWCKRATSLGWQVKVLPLIEILHHHGVSSRKNFRRVLVENVESNCRFLLDHEGLSHAKLAFHVYMVGFLLRIPISWLRQNGLSLYYRQALGDCFKRRSSFFTDLTN